MLSRKMFLLVLYLISCLSIGYGLGSHVHECSAQELATLTITQFGVLTYFYMQLSSIN